MKTEPEILRDGATLLRERGLARGMFLEPSTGAICSIAASSIAAHGETEANLDVEEEHSGWKAQAAVRRRAQVFLEGYVGAEYGLANWSDGVAKRLGPRDGAIFVAERMEKAAAELEELVDG